MATTNQTADGSAAAEASSMISLHLTPAVPLNGSLLREGHLLLEEHQHLGEWRRRVVTNELAKHCRHLVCFVLPNTAPRSPLGNERAPRTRRLHAHSIQDAPRDGKPLMRLQSASRGDRLCEF